MLPTVAHLNSNMLQTYLKPLPLFFPILFTPKQPELYMIAPLRQALLGDDVI